MTIVLVATDGSDEAVRAARAGLGVLVAADRTVVVTVVDGTYPSLTETDLGEAGTGPGDAGSPNLRDRLLGEGRKSAQATADALGRPVEVRVVEGSPGIALCQLAAELPATAIVMGARGHSALSTALRGSVSEYVIRHAPCPVIVSGPEVHG